MDGTTVVCGLDRLSLRIVLALRSLDERVTVVAEAPRPALMREAVAAGARVVPGSSEEIAQLDEVDLRAARCLVLTESADLGNLQVALAARDVNPDLRIVMRMFSTELAERASAQLGLDACHSVPALAMSWPLTRSSPRRSARAF